MDLSWVSEKFTKGRAQAFLVKPHSSTMKLWSGLASARPSRWVLAPRLAPGSPQPGAPPKQGGLSAFWHSTA